uniref:Valyl-tRNA synthetase n=1 Tax=Hangzhou tombus-like virus 3 TaxID=2905490 RepID=A0A8K1XB39_9TOMB|nr:MAG: valyl-tRNA synthetase [Hangzhou tombus-like virus 3]
MDRFERLISDAWESDLSNVDAMVEDVAPRYSGDIVAMRRDAKSLDVVAGDYPGGEAKLQRLAVILRTAANRVAKSAAKKRTVTKDALPKKARQWLAKYILNAAEDAVISDARFVADLGDAFDAMWAAEEREARAAALMDKSCKAVVKEGKSFASCVPANQQAKVVPLVTGADKAIALVKSLNEANKAKQQKSKAEAKASVAKPVQVAGPSGAKPKSASKVGGAAQQEKQKHAGASPTAKKAAASGDAVKPKAQAKAVNVTVSKEQAKAVVKQAPAGQPSKDKPKGEKPKMRTQGCQTPKRMATESPIMVSVGVQATPEQQPGDKVLTPSVRPQRNRGAFTSLPDPSRPVTEKEEAELQKPLIPRDPEVVLAELAPYLTSKVAYCPRDHNTPKWLAVQARQWFKDHDEQGRFPTQVREQVIAVAIAKALPMTPEEDIVRETVHTRRVKKTLEAWRDGKPRARGFLTRFVEFFKGNPHSLSKATISAAETPAEVVKDTNLRVRQGKRPATPLVPSLEDPAAAVRPKIVNAQARLDTVKTHPAAVDGLALVRPSHPLVVDGIELVEPEILPQPVASVSTQVDLLGAVNPGANISEN